MINHLDTAKNQARLLEQQEEEKAKEEYALYQDLGLPSGLLILYKFYKLQLILKPFKIQNKFFNTMTF